MHVQNPKGESYEEKPANHSVRDRRLLDRLRSPVFVPAERRRESVIEQTV